MFNRIGEKLKGLAIAIFIIGTIVCFFIGGFVHTNISEGSGWMVILLGPLMLWISSLFVYGFGEIIVLLTNIEINTRLSKMDEQKSDFSKNAPQRALTNVEINTTNSKINEQKFDSSKNDSSKEQCPVCKAKVSPLAERCPYCNHKLREEK